MPIDLYALIGLPRSSDLAVNTLAKIYETRGALYSTDHLKVWSQERPTRTTLRLPLFVQSRDMIAKDLSVSLDTSVILCLSDFNSFWGYELFYRGEHIDSFAPLPGITGPLGRKAKKAQRGSAEVIAEAWPEVSRDQVAPYLVKWNRAFYSYRKAFPEDQYPSGSGWQVLDFMRRLSLPIEIPGLLEGT